MPCKREGRKAMVKTNLSYALSNSLWLFFMKMEFCVH
jgi:hypothetical protein